jgi:DNA-directed RNA polymerase specialized sigma subunit
MAKKVNYLSNKQLLPEILEFKRTGVASEKLGGQMLMLANKISSKSNFCGYTWREDMVSLACLTMLKYCRNFNPDKSDNPFAYMTSICLNSFRAYLNTQKRHSVIKDQLHKHSNQIDELSPSYNGSIDYTGIKRNGNYYLEQEE